MIQSRQGFKSSHIPCFFSFVLCFVCVYAHYLASSPLRSSHDNKPAGLKAPPRAQRGCAHPVGPPPLQRQLQPSVPQLTSSCPRAHIPAPDPSYLHALPLANQNQQFALARPPMSCPPRPFASESRWVLISSGTADRRPSDLSHVLLSPFSTQTPGSIGSCRSRA